MNPATSSPSSPEAAASPRPPTSCAGWKDQTLATRACLGLLALLAVALVTVLWPHWRENPELSHAFFTPLLSGWLLVEARRSAPRFPGNAGLTAAVVALLLAGLVVLGASGLYAAAVDWSHALVAFCLTVSFVLLLAAGLLVISSTQSRLVPLNWAALTVPALWLLSAPLPPGLYTRLTIGLQLGVTENVLRALHLLGFAASRHGNIIDLAATSVGVEEACSGIRSLVSCVFAGWLFSATLVRTPWARAVLIGLSGPIAIGMNFIRSLTLTLLANAGTDISGRWHDLTGFAVLGVTAAILGGLALGCDRLDRRRLQRTQQNAPAADRNSADREVAMAPEATRQQPTGPSRLWLLPRVLLGGLGIAIALVVCFVANTRPSIRGHQPVPDLAALLPPESDGWQVRTSADLYQFRSTLHTDHLLQRTYFRDTPSGVLQLTLYLAYWPAGQAPVSLVASHTPDACWPGNGWTPVVNRQVRTQIAVGNRQLPEAEARVFRSGEFPQYVWFWHLYDGRPIAYRDPYSARELLRIATRYGFTHDGDQLFVRVSSNRPWAEFAHEPLLADVFSRLQQLGL